jgi:DNA mismatch endonuclease (patch repair protein)
MADIWNKRKRSEVMGLVRSHGNNATELRLIEVLRAHRILGWRRKQKLPGSPDFVFSKERVCVFVDGCFWHCCPKHATFPATRREFWTAKLATNRARDRRVDRALRSNGWKVLRIWQHELTPRMADRTAWRIERALCNT